MQPKQQMLNLLQMAPKRTQTTIVTLYSQHKTDLEHMNNGGRSGSNQWLTILWIHGLNCGLEGLLGSERAYKPTLMVEMGCVQILPRGGNYILVGLTKFTDQTYTIFLWIVDGFIIFSTQNKSKRKFRMCVY